MRLLDAFRAALMLLETATDALEQELSEVERFKLVTGLRRQIIGLQGAK